MTAWIAFFFQTAALAGGLVSLLIARSCAAHSQALHSVAAFTCEANPPSEPEARPSVAHVAP